MKTNKLFWNKFWAIGILFSFCFSIQSCSSSGERQKKSVRSILSIDVKSNTERINEISVCTWNIENFGHTKSNKEVGFIAQMISSFDVVALQEVVGKSGGADAVIRLTYHLNRICKPCQWRYSISLRTSGSSYQSERYAYLWKESEITNISIGWLDENFSNQIEREPFMATFEMEDKSFTLVSFHAIPKSKQPETEIKYLKYFPNEYADKHLIFLGDFNTPYTHTVFNPLKKMGYRPALIDQKTTLRQKCINGDCLASKYDNIFYPTNYIEYLSSGIVHFYKYFKEDMRKAKKISDHVPVFFNFSIKK